MREFMQQMYQAVSEDDVDSFYDIEDSIKRGEIELSVEDIVPLCKLIIFDSEFIEYSQIIEIARMTLWAVEEENIKAGFQELAKGLEEIYNEGIKDTWTNWYHASYKDFIDIYIGVIICRYKEEDMVLFGEAISKSESIDFKSMMLQVLKRTMMREEETEGYIAKGKILENSIKR